MEAYLDLLLRRGYLNRKQLREIRNTPLRSLEDLRRNLLERGWIDPPDWKEALEFLRPGLEAAPGEDIAPDSQNEQMQAIQQTALRVAGSEATVLLLGESGVGKTRLAQLIHNASPRRGGPFVTVACGSIPETLLESELFGVERGAYTGATRSRPGRFLRAHGGTIFLDEIGELSAALQVKLLRVLQERKIEALGSDEETEVDVRLVAATNRDLESEVQAGRFREDLYFRINVVPLTLPALRERSEDIVPLARFFLHRLSEERRQSLRWSDPRMEQALRAYRWPGNIRELENCIERLAALAVDGELRPEDLPPRIQKEAGVALPVSIPAAAPPGSGGAIPTLREMELQLIRAALQRSGGNIVESARSLGIHRNTLARKLEEFGIDPARFKRREEKAPAAD